MNLQDAADALGVHYQTVYRWVRSGEITAFKQGASYVISDDEVERFLSKRTIGDPPPERIQVRDWAHHIDRLEELLLAGDELEARSALDRLSDGGVPLVELCEELIAPTLARVGDGWHRGKVSIAEEHRATAICERLLARLSSHPRGRPRGTAVVIAAPEDEHGFPSAMAAMALREDRWRVHHLGTQVPQDDLLNLAKDVDADVIVISATTAGPTTSARSNELIERLESAGHQVLMGGPGRRLSDLVAEARRLN
jgi:MerR family transcriptional regulator, light-induced transcriptional regulator